MKKPDRWERILERHAGDEDDWRAMLIPASRALTLLRREHAATVRMVNNRVPKKAWSPDVRLGYGQAVMDILDRLARRRR